MVPLSPTHEHPHVIHAVEEYRQPNDGRSAEESAGQRDQVAGGEAPRHSGGLNCSKRGSKRVRESK